MTSEALRADTLGMWFGDRWALRDCTFTLPTAAIAALVGPNGAGKTTLFRLAAGLLQPTTGTLTVQGTTPSGATPPGVAFVAQHAPLYARFRVAEMLRAAAALNPTRFDTAYARTLLDAAEISQAARIRALSPGQRTRVALALALARRPRLLLLDEPLADLDPLARKQTLGVVLAEAAESGATVLLSSHVVADIEDACDHLVLLGHGHAPLAGPIPDLLDEHHLLTEPSEATPTIPAGGVVVRDTVSGRELTRLVRGAPPPAGRRPGLEDLVLPYLQTTPGSPR
ncbi:ATP-binding cassette domain-containing protein [Pseudonocardia sp. RS010]|uniref:ATP-binding cassette domain-containing protein n=1 Tax=Pseudonocardia sp. RS010 TaxID=3385979 RepID=UPI0039A0F1B2